jgi:hypothetical protein
MSGQAKIEYHDVVVVVTCQFECFLTGIGDVHDGTD